MIVRRILDFVFILLFVWTCLIIELWIIDSLIVPLNLPGTMDTALTAIFRVGISFAMVLAWLWLWREIVKRTFWRAIRRQHIKEQDK